MLLKKFNWVYTIDGEIMKKRKLKIGNIILFGLAVLVTSFILFTIITSLFKKEDVKLFNIKGKTLSEIETYTKENNISLNIDYEYSDDVKKDGIIKQSIENDTKITDNMKLDIVVSKGIDYKKYNVDELGFVPIMMYHGIHNLKNEDTEFIGGNVDEDGYQRTAEAFREDLEFYYMNGYRMIRLNDYINGIIDVKAGLSPIVLTFDDGLENNIKVTGLDKDGNIIIDPNSAVGILEEYKKKYPDFNVTATFFVNGGLFNQNEYNEKILNWLVDNGYDVGNHTNSHPDFTTISSTQSQREVSSIYKILDKIIPNKYVKIVALPFGSPYDIDHTNFKDILSGNYDGYEYETISTLRVGWEPERSPFSKNVNIKFLKRIRAYDANGKEGSFDIKSTFKNLEANRYISDGDKNTIVIMENDEKYLGNTYNLEVIKY